VIEREMNVETGQISENVELENLDEEETDNFKNEWRQRSSHAGLHRRSRLHFHPQLTSTRPYHDTSTDIQQPQLAIEYDSSTGNNTNRSHLKLAKHSKSSSSQRRSSHQTDTIDLTDDTPNDEDVKEIEQLPSTQVSSVKRKASWPSSNDVNSQRKHRQNRS
jgi:hypothetical protein